MYSKMQGRSGCARAKRIDSMPSSEITTISPFSTSRTKRAPMMSSAQVSEPGCSGRRVRPAPAGGCRGDRGRRSAFLFGHHHEGVGALDLAQGIHHPSTMRTWRERATRWRIASLSEVDWQIAPSRTSWRRSKRPLVRLPLWATESRRSELGEERLPVAQDRLAGGRVADVADRGLAFRRSIVARSERTNRRRGPCGALRMEHPAVETTRCRPPPGRDAARRAAPSATIAAASGWP